MHWISLDWDFITGDCRKNGEANRCTANCCDCSDTGIIGRGDHNTDSIHKDWDARLEYTTMMFSKLNIVSAVVYDNHGEILKFLKRGDTVENYDYHTDDWDTKEVLAAPACWNWVNHAARSGITVHYYYNTGDLRRLDPLRDYRLFVAWSVPYTRPDLDGHLFRFLMGLGCEVKLNG